MLMTTLSQEHIFVIRFASYNATVVKGARDDILSF